MAFQTERTPGIGYGNSYIDSLVWGSQWSSSTFYAGPFPVDDPVIVQYEFFGDNEYYQGYKFYVWSPTQISQFSEALRVFEHVCNLRFSPAADVADLYFLQLDSTFFGGTNTLGLCEVPDAQSDPNLGLFNYSASQWRDLNQGSAGFYVLIHELGHGLGLAHPHDGGSGDSPTKFPGVSGPWILGLNEINQGIWSIMSYNFDPSWVGHESPDAYGHSMTPMALDIAALQAIYGANTGYRIGADLYELPQQNASGTGWSCIWDAGGVDAISNEESSLSCSINLNAAVLDGEYAGGYVSWANGVVGGYTIANGVVIENAIGGLGDDEIIGNLATNCLDGAGGADYLWGDKGFDTLYGGNGNDSLHGGMNADLLFGGDGDDLLGGGAGHDQINGGSGDDVIRGAKGMDTLTGGDGSDTFIFATELDGQINIDLITDFVSGVDRIELSISVFGALTSQLESVIGLGGYLIYDQTSGYLAYDSDGGGVIDPIAFAIIGTNTHPEIGHDFVVVM